MPDESKEMSGQTAAPMAASTPDLSASQPIVTLTESDNKKMTKPTFARHGKSVIGWLAAATLAVASILLFMMYAARHNANLVTPTATATQPASVTAMLTTDKLSGIFPSSQEETFDLRFQANIFQGLTQIDANGRASGLLAKQWSNPNTSTWNFELRPDAVFSNGQPVKAADVVFSINQSIANQWPGSSEITPTVDKVTALANGQVQITTKGVDPILLNELAQVYIINQTQYTTKTAAEYAIGSGAYVPASFTTSSDAKAADKYVLTANTHYYLDKPAIKTINVFAESPDQDSLQYGIDNKASVIVLGTLSTDDKAKLVKAGYTIKNAGSNSVDYIGFDQSRAKTPYVDQPTNPFLKLAVRQALYKAIDFKVLGANPPEIGLELANQMAPASVFGSDPSLKPLTYDVTTAKQMLTDAGYPNGFTVTMDGPDFALDQVQQVIKMWKDNLGVTVNYNGLDANTGIDKLSNHDTSAYFLGMEFNTYDVAAMSPFLDATDASNFGRYSNPDATTIVNKLSTTLDLDQRKALLQKLERTVSTDVGFIPLWFIPDMYAVKTGIDFPSAKPATWSAQ